MASTTELIIAALLSRGYSECKRGIESAYRCFAISPTHARRIDPNGRRVWLYGSHFRLGSTWDFGKPIPRATRANLADEGRAVVAKPENINLRILGL